MLRELSRKIELLDHHFANAQILSPQMKETYINSRLSLLNFLTRSIEFIRSQTAGNLSAPQLRMGN